MKKIENVILKKFKSFKLDKIDNKMQLSIRDSIESRYNTKDDLLIVKYKLWDSEIFKYYKSKDEETVYISFCGYNTQVTRQRLRIFEDTFNFSIDNVSTGKYELKYCGNKFTLYSKDSYEAIYKLDLRNKTISIL